MTKYSLGSHFIDGSEVELFLVRHPKSQNLAIVGCHYLNTWWLQLTSDVEGLAEDEIAVNVKGWGYESVIRKTGMFEPTDRTLSFGFNVYPVWRVKEPLRNKVML